jgi:hypothetical protein
MPCPAAPPLAASGSLRVARALFLLLALLPSLSLAFVCDRVISPSGAPWELIDLDPDWLPLPKTQQAPAPRTLHFGAIFGDLYIIYGGGASVGRSIIHIFHAHFWCTRRLCVYLVLLLACRNI